jgi:hypothetical protein
MNPFQGFQFSTTTPVPDEIFDRLMYDMTGSELKVLLYICRRTFGFKKDSDNISLAQLMNGITTREGKVLDRGTGLSEPTLLKALRNLDSAGVIVRTQHQSPDKGSEPTTYSLKFIGPPVLNKLGEAPPQKTLGGPSPNNLGTQETVLQQTVLQETEEYEKATELTNVRSVAKEKSRWLEILERDSRWPREEDLVFQDDVESCFIAPRALDLAQGRAHLAEIALCAYEWLQTDKGKKKTPRGMKLFWHNWLKKEGPNATFEQPNLGKYPGRDSKPTEQERIREKRRADIADLQRRIDEVNRAKAEGQRNAGGTS